MDNEKPLSHDDKIKILQEVYEKMRNEGLITQTKHLLWEGLKSEDYATEKYLQKQDEIMALLKEDLDNYEHIHQQHLDEQLKTSVVIREKNGAIREIKEKFDHTIRHALQFHNNLPSTRYQLIFSPQLGTYPLFRATTDPEKNDQEIIQASIFDRAHIPEDLIYAFVSSWDNNKDPIPEQCLKPGKIHLLRIHLMKNPVYMESYKTYLAGGKPLHYLVPGTPQENNPDGMIARQTARVVLLPDGKILLMQHIDEYYTEKHLRKYRGSDFFIKIFPSTDAYLAYEHKTIQTLQEPINRFDFLKSWMTSELWDKNDDGLLREEIKTAHGRWEKTIEALMELFESRHSPEDQAITNLLRQMYSSKHTGHIKQRYNKIETIIETREQKEKNMISTIRRQMQQV